MPLELELVLKLLDACVRRLNPLLRRVLFLLHSFLFVDKLIRELLKARELLLQDVELLLSLIILLLKTAMVLKLSHELCGSLQMQGQILLLTSLAPTTGDELLSLRRQTPYLCLQGTPLILGILQLSLKQCAKHDAANFVVVLACKLGYTEQIR